MAMVPQATQGNFIHVYDFRVKPGSGERFIEMFNKADYSDDNPMHKTNAQVKDGVLCRDTENPDRVYLIGEWSDIEVHRAVRKTIKRTGPTRAATSATQFSSGPLGSPAVHCVASRTAAYSNRTSGAFLKGAAKVAWSTSGARTPDLH